MRSTTVDIIEHYGHEALGDVCIKCKAYGFANGKESGTLRITISSIRAWREAAR